MYSFFFFFINKGKGVFTTIPFKRDDFILQYKGDILSSKEGEEREKQYADDEGNFLFFFKHQGKTCWYVLQVYQCEISHEWLDFLAYTQAFNIIGWNKKCWNLLFPFCFVIGQLCLGDPAFCSFHCKSCECWNLSEQTFYIAASKN